LALVHPQVIRSPMITTESNPSTTGAGAASTAITATMASTIEAKISAALTPSYLEVINESANHNVPKGSETHFKLIVVSAQFDGQRTLHCHRMVYAILEQELAGSVHALALHTYTEEQWREVDQAPDSPSCRGGMKAEAQSANEV
jgi:BolA protein